MHMKIVHALESPFSELKSVCKYVLCQTVNLTIRLDQKCGNGNHQWDEISWWLRKIHPGLSFFFKKKCLNF